MRAYNNLAGRQRTREFDSMTESQFLRLVVQKKEDTMTIRDATYARFEGFEEALAHCYFVLHERFIANPPLAKFWAEAAMEEMQHFSILRFCRERMLMADVELNLTIADHIEELLEMVKDIVNDPDVSIDEAFYAALLVESSEMDEVYEKFTQRLAKDHRILYEAVRANLRSHQDRFADATEQFCKDSGLTAAFRSLGKSERQRVEGRNVS
jgi:hypothetical protein